MELNKKCIEILQYLIKRNDYVKTEELAKIHNVTERSIRYSIDTIERFLVKNGYEYLEKKHNIGVKLKNQEGLEDFLKKFLKAPIPFKYNYSKQERFEYILLKILQVDYPIKILEFEKSLYISRNTVLKELDKIEIWLQAKGLKLIRKPRVGIMVEGGEYDKRKVIIELISQTVSTEDILNYAEHKIARCRMKNFQFDMLFSDIDISFLDVLIRRAEIELGRKFSDEAYGGLLTHLAIMIKRIQLNKIIYLPQVQLRADEIIKEYKVAKIIIEEIEKKFNIIIPKEEIDYITLHLSGAGVLHAEYSVHSEFKEDMIYEIASIMTNEIESIYNVDFGQEKTHIIHGLVIHLRPGLFRMKYNKKIINPIFEDIKIKYSKLLLDTTYVARHIEKFIGKEIDQHEISYIALHFGAAIKNAKKQEKQRLKIIIVCGSGIGTAKMIASQIAGEFNVEITHTISCRDIDILNDKVFDFIVSTVEIPNLDEKQYIRISPLLSNKDYEKLEAFFKPRYKRIKNDDKEIYIVNKFIRIVEKYCHIQDREHLKYELLYEIKNIDKGIEGGELTYMLGDLITKDTIELNVSCKDWIEAIKAGTTILLEKGYVELGYEKAIINNFNTIGPYMVVAPGIVLSHARPESGVNTLSMSLITLKEPIEFGSETNDPVKIIITLAAVDNDTHLKALAQLMELFMNSDDMEMILNTSSKNSVIKIINKYSN